MHRRKKGVALQDSNQGLARWHTGPSKMGHGSLQDSTQDLARQDMGPSKTGHRAWQDGTWGLAEQDIRPCEMGQSQSMSPTVPPVADAWYSLASGLWALRAVCSADVQCFCGAASASFFGGADPQVAQGIR